MEPPHPPSPKLRLMVSYGGHILPRPNKNCFFYAGGETRIVSLNRRTLASSFSSFHSFLSKTLFNNRPFHLKYQLPNEDLDSLISVSTDEDLLNMLEEHDRLSSCTTPSRIRLFLFPIKGQSLGFFDTKGEGWFTDALNSTGGGLVDGLMGLEVSSMEGKNGGVPESMVLETNSSFGSTSSSISMSNLPPIGVQYEDGGVGLMDKKGRVPSSASMESDTSIGSSGVLPKPVAFQESLRQVALGAPTFSIDPEIGLADPSTMVQFQKTVQLSGYQLPQQLDGKQHLHEFQYIQGSTPYIPQYPATLHHPTSYYPVYQIPMHQQQNDSHKVNQPYPAYYYPVHPVQSYNMPMHNNVINSQNLASSRPPLHPQTATVLPPVVHKEILTVQPSSDSAAGLQGTVYTETSLVSVPSGQGQQLMPPPEHVQPSQPVPAAIVDITNSSNELDDNIAYTQIYKTQPSVPLMPSNFPVHAVGAPVVMSDSSK